MHMCERGRCVFSGPCTENKLAGRAVRVLLSETSEVFPVSDYLSVKTTYPR